MHGRCSANGALSAMDGGEEEHTGRLVLFMAKGVEQEAEGEEGVALRMVPEQGQSCGGPVRVDKAACTQVGLGERSEGEDVVEDVLGRECCRHCVHLCCWLFLVCFIPIVCEG